MYEQESPEETLIRKNLVNDKTNKKAYYKITDFPKMLIFEENFSLIQKEFLNLIDNPETDKGFFEPWCEKDLYEDSNPTGWLVAPLIINCNTVENKIKKVPFLENLLKRTKGIITASFSCLMPNTWIVPHKGYENYSEKVLRYHIGLKIPKGDLGLRVHKIQTKWVEGKSIIFDDSLIHEAWNYSDDKRYVLIIDFLRSDDIDFNITELPDLMLTDQARTYMKLKK